MNSQRISIIGSSGLLGREVLALARQEADWTVLTPGQNDLERVDITDYCSLASHIEAYRPNVIINCAAFSQVDACEAPEGFEKAKAINGNGVGNLAKLCKFSSTKLVHISSDYIFGDNRPEGYDEYYGNYSPLNNYGRSKVMGEQQLTQVFGGIINSDFLVQEPKAYIIRTSWLFGQGMNNFIGKIISYAKRQEQVRVVDDEFGSPTYIKDLSRTIVYVVRHDLRGGVYHAAGNGHCSRYEFAKRVLNNIGLADKVQPMKLRDYERPAKVPSVSYLVNTKLPPARRWEEMVDDFAGDEFQKINWEKQ